MKGNRPHRNPDDKKRRGSPEPGGRTGGGIGRGPDDVEELTDAAENLMLYGAGDRLLSRGLGEAAARMKAKREGREFDGQFELMPKSTVYEYKDRVKARWAANPIPRGEEYRERQVMRLEGQIRTISAQGGPGHRKDVADRERILSRISGAELTHVEHSGPGGSPLPEVLAPPAQTIRVVVYVPDNGKRVVPRKEGGDNGDRE